MQSELTAERLRELLTYDPETGVMRWRVRVRSAHRIHVGDIAGCVSGADYHHVKIDGRAYRRSWLAWLYTYGRWPAPQIDHINRCRTDDRFCNLREATPAQNSANRGPPTRPWSARAA